jgi:ABC-type amino acid transport substrate-binding protein
MTPILESVGSVEVEPGPDPTAFAAGDRALGRIRSRGALRVGLIADRLPFAYRDAEGRWVGYDVEMANALARELGVSLQLLEVKPPDVARCLEDDWCDLVMGGLVETGELTEQVLLSAPYLFASVGAIVPDHRRSELGTYELLRKQARLRIAIDDLRYAPAIRSEFPDAEIVEGDPKAFLRGELKVEVDLMITIAESAFPWTIPHPEFDVVNPLRRLFEVPLVYGINPRYPAAPDYVNRWLAREKRRGTQQVLYDYWVLGDDQERKPPRWSILRDVLGWID